MKISTQEIPTDGIWIDKYGVKFSADKTKLIKANKDLRHYKIPSGTKIIANEAFMECNLFEVHIPDTVTHIGTSAFNNCSNLQTLYLPDSVVYVGEAAFLWCESLQRVSIPKSIAHLGESAFAFCLSLHQITLR